MLSRRTIFATVLLALASFTQAGPCFADEQSAHDFLKSIYDTYVGNPDQALGVPLDGEAVIRRYFEPSLAALILKDQEEAAKLDEAPTLDGDPFVNAQEWQIDTVKIAVKEAGPGKATGTVTFHNFDRPETIVLDLVKIHGEWRISDIHWGDETLRELLSPQ